jgi:hypothetical protein
MPDLANYVIPRSSNHLNGPIVAYLPKKIPRNPKFRYRIYNSPPPFPILNKENSIHILRQIYVVTFKILYVRLVHSMHARYLIHHTFQ